jgi:hypothetical protein
MDEGMPGSPSLRARREAERGDDPCHTSPISKPARSRPISGRLIQPDLPSFEKADLNASAVSLNHFHTHPLK